MAASAGSFVWYEYMASEMKAAADFYAKAVGWDLKDSDMANFPYTLFCGGAAPVGGVAALPEEARRMGARPGWIGYLGVPDVDAYAAKAAAAGARVLKPAADLPGVGRFAVLADPDDAGFILFKGGAADQPRARLADDASGNVGWRELRAGAPDRAFAFYSGLFGWTKTRAMDMGPAGAYQVFATAGGQPGGMMAKTADAAAPFWLFYFNVEAIDAAAQRLAAAGGGVVAGPHEVPGGGWVVRAVDPEGAPFALLAPKR
jgi:predicted enzyme related to lactoylglutathione lyase